MIVNEGWGRRDDQFRWDYTATNTSDAIVTTASISGTGVDPHASTFTDGKSISVRFTFTSPQTGETIKVDETVVIAAEGIGWMLGSILLPLYPKLFRNSKSIVICITIYALSMILLVISTNFVISIISLIVGGVFHVLWWTVIIILLQNLADNFYRGRVIGLFFTFVQLTGLGFIIGGWSGEIFGILNTIILSSVLLIMIHFFIFLISRKFRSLSI